MAYPHYPPQTPLAVQEGGPSTLVPQQDLLSGQPWYGGQHTEFEACDGLDRAEDSESEMQHLKCELEAFEKNKCQHDACGAHFRTVCETLVPEGPRFQPR